MGLFATGAFFHFCGFVVHWMACLDSMKKNVWIALPLLLLAVCIMAGTAFLTLSRPVVPQATETKRFIVPRGQAISVIGERLREEGLIRNSLVFRVIVQKEGLRNKIQAGSFDLSAGMSTPEIAQALTQGTNDVWITIPEGWRREEIARSLAEQELDSFDEKEFERLTQGKEGRLFPDTYLVPRQTTEEHIVALLERTFERKILEDLATEIESSAYDFQDALIMASIVEREARGAEEMKVVAGILWNRIEIGMPLQADATLQYVKGINSQDGSWWSPPTAADKSLQSPFNTYLNPGLPPRPISNPGLNAIQAALHPTKTSYLYYIHDLEGTVRYAETLDQHNANVNRYLR